ncbi:restriction endonuclease subunit S [Priestia megaterium]|uniref:restriction endonuclease subunit S n=1 Tax=Priestia megaterium TaxID=1404 RepID=UPI002E1EEF58|nr:restriction endonuclease subunit S [Priestia megaterium]
METEWVEVNLKDICVNKSNTCKDLESANIERYVGLEHLEPEDLRISSWGLVKDGTTFTKIFSSGQVLFGKRRSYQKKAAVADFSGVCSGDILVLEAKQDLIIPELLPYIVQNDNFFDYAVGTSSGSLSPRTSWKHLSSYKVRIPQDKSTQKEIVERLNKIEYAIIQKKNLEKATRIYKKKLMKEILSKGINYAEFKQTDFGEIPLTWKIQKLYEISSRVTRKNKEELTDNVLTISAQLGLVNQMEFFNKKVASKNLQGYYLLEKGDFAYNKSYSNGYPMGAIKPLERYDLGVVSSLYICFRMLSDFVNNNFMKYYFESDLWHSEVSKIAQEGARNHGLLNISVKDFFEINICLPPLIEQEKIVSILSKVDAQIKSYEQESLKMIAIKKSLQQRLL